MKLLSVTVLIIFLAGCVSHEYVDRDNGIPDYKVKLTPQLDEFPPILHSSDYETPVPLTYPVNTAGGEDSPFITPDGRTLYVFFTPDVDVPVEEQLLDGLTGIYVTHLLNNGSWTFPTRLWLNDPGRLSLDGCAFVINNTIWFCSAREGFTGLH